MPRAMIACVALALAGCVQFEPAYPVSSLTSDDGMVGVWSFTDEDGETRRVRISERPLNVHEGRIEPRGLLRAEKASGEGNVAGAHGYTIAHETATGRPSEMFGYLVRHDDRSCLMGVHQPEVAGESLGWTLPLHFVGRVERDGDELRLSMSRVMIAWIPRVRWVDEAPAPADGEFAAALDADESGQIYITNSIDRVIAIYKRYATEPGFWNESGCQTLRRVNDVERPK